MSCGDAMINFVELLAAYLNTPPELDQALQSLVKLGGEPGKDQSVASPPCKVRARLPRSIVSKIVADYQAGASSLELAEIYDLPKSSMLALLTKEGVVRPARRISALSPAQAARVANEADQRAR